MENKKSRLPGFLGKRDQKFIFKQVCYLYLFLVSKTLDILCLLDLGPAFHRWFCELLALPQLTHSAGLIKLSLKTL